MDAGEKMQQKRTDKNDLEQRTKEFALRIIRMYSALPKTEVGRVLGGQVLRSGTSVGAHYREARRARSTAEFVSKIEGGLQELSETQYWLELLVDGEVVRGELMEKLLGESDELMAILIASVKTAKRTLNAKR